MKSKKLKREAWVSKLNWNLKYKDPRKILFTSYPTFWAHEDRYQLLCILDKHSLWFFEVPYNVLVLVSGVPVSHTLVALQFWDIKETMSSQHSFYWSLPWVKVLVINPVTLYYLHLEALQEILWNLCRGGVGHTALVHLHIFRGVHHDLLYSFWKGCLWYSWIYVVHI